MKHIFKKNNRYNYKKEANMKIIYGDDGTYYVHSASFIEHQKEDGTLVIYYSVHEIPSIYDQKKVSEYLEEEED